jgi:hypothetical protein
MDWLVGAALVRQKKFEKNRTRLRLFDRTASAAADMPPWGPFS